MKILNNKTFTSKNDGFSCQKCNRMVPPTSKSCRNHCPYCLYSKHVDVNPGDKYYIVLVRGLKILIRVKIFRKIIVKFQDIF